jgi:hypothetical protein
VWILFVGFWCKLSKEKGYWGVEMEVNNFNKFQTGEECCNCLESFKEKEAQEMSNS